MPSASSSVRRKPGLRKPGAQPGNLSALRHGFYSRRFRDVEPEDLEVINAQLTSEIAGLRVAARRVLQLSETLENQDPMRAIHALSFFGLLCTRIASITRTHAQLTGNSNETNSAISLALQCVIKEFNLRKP